MTLLFDPAAAAQLPRDYQRELTAALLAATDRHEPGRKLLIEVATGGGKTRIVNDFVAVRALGEGKRALVVTKDWPLLAQMAGDLCARHRGALGAVGYVGGSEADDLFRGAAIGAAARVVYTTIHTWFARRDADFADARFDFVVIDEVHWGEGAKLYRALFQRYSGTSTFVGATATPRRSTAFERVGRAWRFADLVELGVLAAPVVTTVETGVRWSPRTSSAHGDFLPSSLSDLATDPERNETIVDTYLSRADDWDKTLVFACDVDHAVGLADDLSSRGVAAAAIHCQMPKAEARATFDAFKESRIDVLVNVAMMTHGVDVPDIRTVFLCRPTTSEILFSQMIGRGSRIAEGKTEFNVVDFVDAVEQHGVDIVRPDGFLGSARSSGRRRCPRLKAHAFEPAEFELLTGSPGYEALAGLEIQPSQTFGIEFEAARRRGRRFDYSTAARRLLEALREVVPAAAEPLSVHGGPKDNALWNVEPDPSCGIEVTTRILRGREGFEEVVDALGALGPALEELRLTVDHRSVGTHVHLGWPFDVERVVNLLATGAYFEPAILSLVAPSRAASSYLLSARRPLKALLSTDEAEREEVLRGRRWKHVGINPGHLVDGYGTVEVRYHSGTADAAKILQWVSLWMRIMSAAERGGRPGDPLRRVLSRPLCRGPRGDVLSLCDFVGAGDELRRRLVARRHFVISHSWAPHEFHGVRMRRLIEQWSEEGSR